jgi:SAM-dependent methyltransferase
MATDDGYFGEAAAASYDENAAERFSPEVLKPTVGLIAELAGDGSVLEFGIGTGRVAMALSQRGIPVSGIELSRAMVSKLREKPGSDAIQVTIGDMATTTVGASFRVVYLVFNTIMNLTTQSAQVACFRNASAHLEPGGCFVIECMFPNSGGFRLARRSASSMGAMATGESMSTTPLRRASCRIMSKM